jgi:hypothetical protein
MSMMATSNVSNAKLKCNFCKLSDSIGNLQQGAREEREHRGPVSDIITLVTMSSTLTSLNVDIFLKIISCMISNRISSKRDKVDLNRNI